MKRYTIAELYQEGMISYASYVILERAIPAIEDGLKPVQRRLLHAMHQVEDGRYNKVANIIGQTMQYHPHGDGAIGDALVKLGQKGLLIDCQGNWGDSRTGDGAAASRYIEARLTPFALEVAYSPAITSWVPAYDGRKQEPKVLPMKFPLLLAQGVEGIAVGLSTRILPHNVAELLEGAIDLLRGKPITLYPDFPGGGIADCTAYKQGKKGARVQVRSLIEVVGKHSLEIKTLPYGITTKILVESILKAQSKGQVKIKQIIDNTAQEVSIKVILSPETPVQETIWALYHFTDCQVSLAPHACVIKEDKPSFLGVETLLAYSTQRTKALLEAELKIEQRQLQEQLFFVRLERFFITKKIYKVVEQGESMSSIMACLQAELMPFQAELYRPIQQEDLTGLLEIPIRRISRYDLGQKERQRQRLTQALEKNQYHLEHLVAYTVAWYRKLLQKYGPAYPRRTKLTTFELPHVEEVIPHDQVLYVDRKKGFVGIGLKEGTLVGSCPAVGDLIVIRRNGTCVIVPIAEKSFIGVDILHVALYQKKQKPVYHLLYVDGATGKTRAKRFHINGVMRHKAYRLTTDHPHSRILYLCVHPEPQEEVVRILLSPLSKARKQVFCFSFEQVAIKGRAAQGNIVTAHAVKKVTRERICPADKK